MKSKLLILGLLAIVFVGFITTVSALTSKSNIKLIETNLKQAEIAGKIRKIVKEDEYPSYFGGVYISDDSSHVVIQIVKDKIPTEKNSKDYATYNEIAKMNSEIEIEYVKYSQKELNDINDKLIEYFSSEKADLSNLSAHYVDTFNNVVVVELKDNDVKQVEIFKKTTLDNNDIISLALDSDIVVFTKGEQHTDQLKAGQQISVTGGSCSMGYRVKINGKQGYITAGHCFNAVGDSSTGGIVTKRQYSGKVDAAFVETNAWTNLFNAPSNSLYYASGTITSLNNNLCPNLSLNQLIAKTGFKTGYTSGQIKNLNYSATYNGTYFTGLVATNYSSEGGDSGGAVFVPTNVSGGAPLAGIHKGTSSYGTAFVNENQIYLVFGYSRY